MSDFLFRGTLRDIDPDVYELTQLEAERQARKLILIASESTAPAGVREAMGSTFQNLYAEGYPDEDTRFMSEDEILDYDARLAHFRRYSDPRYYKGVEYADIVEALARRRCAELFAANGFSADQIQVNVQALSGAPANNAVYNGLVNVGDTVMGMNLLYGGHLTHGSPVNRSGKLYKIVPYTIDPATQRIDLNQVESLAKEHKPKMIIVGYSSYPWAADFNAFRQIADSVGAFLMADMAHVAGLIAAGVYPNPVGIAHVVTFTTHKTLDGPRGACILTTDPALARKIDRAVFPGEQGGPHVNIFAALAASFKLAATPQFKELQAQTVRNSVRFAAQMEGHGFTIPFGGTESHLFNVDCKSVKGADGTPLMGDMAARILDLAGVVTNRNTIPGDTSALNPSGLRLGTPWITQRGFKEPEVDRLAAAMAQVLHACQPFKYPGRKGDIFRARVDFEAFQDAKLQVRALAAEAGIDYEHTQHGYPHFYYFDDPAPAEPFTSIEVSGPRAAEFLYWATTADPYTLEPGEAAAARLYTPKGQIAGTLQLQSAGHPSPSGGRAVEEGELQSSPSFRLTLPSSHSSLALAWLRDLSDGYVAFDPGDPLRKLPGPVSVRQAGGVMELPKAANSAGAGDDSAAHTKPWFIGCSAWAIDAPPALAEFRWEPPADAPLRRTALYDTHKALGGRMVPFGGWEMPVQYTGVLEEHLATRQAAGLFDVSHMGVWDVSGPTAAAFLDALVTNEISSLRPGESMYAQLLAPAASVIDDCYAYCLAPDHYLFVVNASNDDKDWAWANAVQRGEVMVDADRPWAKVPGRVGARLRDLRAESSGADRRVDIALQGPKSRDILLALGADPDATRRIKALKRTELCLATVGGFDLIVARTGYTGEQMSFELFVHPDRAVEFWNALLKVGGPQGLKPAGLAARDSLRTEAGLPLYGEEMAGSLELGVGDAGFESYVKTHKPWFIGRAAFIQQERARKAEVVRFRFVAKSGRMAHYGDPVLDDKGRVVGTVTSCSIDTEGYRLGQAYVELKSAAEGTPIAIFQSASDKPEKPRKSPKSARRWSCPSRRWCSAVSRRRSSRPSIVERPGICEQEQLANGQPPPRPVLPPLSPAGPRTALPGAALARPQPGPLLGILYNVNSLEDAVPAFDDYCTLREAIMAANGEATDCGQPGADTDEINFVVTGTVTLIYDLPAINDHLTIDGNNQITIDGVDSWRIFTVNSGKTLTLNDLVLYRAFAESEGGAIRSFGTLYVNNSAFIDNHANSGGGGIYSFGVADIRYSQFLSNTGSVGGAILNPGILGLTDSLFQGNNADLATRGGAIWSSGPLTIVGGQFIANRAGAGGAIYARREVGTTSLAITGAAFDENLALAKYPDGNGGALLIDNLAANIQASTFTQNGSQTGGAIYLAAAGALTLTHSTLHDGLSTNGGGLYNLGTAHLTSVTLSANRASHGGGIDNFGLLFLTNVTLSQNRASYGGGLKNESGTATLSNVTLWGNTAANEQGGGIMNTDLNSHLNLTNVIVAGSPIGGNCAFAPAPDLSQFNLSSDNTCSFGVGRNNLNVKLDPLRNNGGLTQTHMPQLDSPAIGNGTDDDAPSVDQRGIGRPQGTFYDVGSVEVAPGEATQYLDLPLILR